MPKVESGQFLQSRNVLSKWQFAHWILILVIQYTYLLRFDITFSSGIHTCRYVSIVSSLCSHTCYDVLTLRLVSDIHTCCNPSPLHLHWGFIGS